MRKLRQAEIAVLVAGLTIGNALVHADENFDGPTITVTGTVNTITIFLAPTGVDLSSASQAFAAGTNGTSTAADQAHAINCAKTYSGKGTAGTPAANAGPKPGYFTTMVGDYGWGKDPFYVQATLTNVNPGPGWGSIQGSTSPIGAASGSTIIFLNSVGSSRATLVNTLAHEWSHQWGATDNDPDPNKNAYAIGAAAQAAYQNGNGAACGGL